MSILQCLRCFLLPLIIALPATGSIGSDPTNSDTIRFDFDGVSSISHSLAFKDGKSDYIWGTFERHGEHFHTLNYILGRSNPDNPKEFSLSLIERIDIEGGELEFNRNHRIIVDSVDSVDQAKQIESTCGDPEELFYTFRKAIEGSNPSWQKAASGFTFLGFIREGNLIELRAKVGPEKPLVLRGSTIEFEVEPETGFITKLTKTTPPEPVMPPPPPEFDPSIGEMVARKPPARYLGGTSVVMLKTDDRHLFISSFTSSGKYASDTRDTILSGEQQIRNISNEVSWPFEFQFPPTNGDAIVLLDNQQIKAIWQDGKIVRAFDGGVAEELASAHFRKPSTGFWTWFVLGSGILVTVIWLGIRMRKRYV